MMRGFADDLFLSQIACQPATVGGEDSRPLVTRCISRDKELGRNPFVRLAGIAELDFKFPVTSLREFV